MAVIITVALIIKWKTSYQNVAPAPSRTLAFWSVLSLLHTTLNKAYIIFSYVERMNLQLQLLKADMVCDI